MENHALTSRRQSHWDRISPLQRLPPPVPRSAWYCRWYNEPKHHLPQLRHRLRPRRPRLVHRLLGRRSHARRREVHDWRTQVFARRIHGVVGHLHVFVHDELNTGVGARVYVCKQSRAVRVLLISLPLSVSSELTRSSLQERCKSTIYV